MKKIHFVYLIAFLCFSCVSVFAQNPHNADIVIAKDGSGDFTTIQEAINAVESNNERRTIIYLKRGLYDTEKLIIPSNKKNITMIGESRDETIISYHLYDCSNEASANKCPADAYELWKDNADLVRTSATLTIAADGFIAENLTIQNTAGPVGQALAITVTGDKGIYRNCNLLGYQDTIYLWTAGKRSYFENCLVAGRTDYIYGAGIAFFQACEIRSWGGGWITAPSTPQNQAYGYVFNECKVTYATNSPRNGDDGAKFALGRPWHGYPKVSWLYCEMSDMINPLGWPTTWNMEYAATSTDLHLYEYKNTGPGADMSGRANWAGLRAMTDLEAPNYTVKKVMAGSDGWDPTAELSPVTNYTWTGATNQSWKNASNWSPEGIPGAGDAAYIEPILADDQAHIASADGGIFEADLNLLTGGQLDIQANSSVNYMALTGGKLLCSSGTAILSGKIQTKAASEFKIDGELNLAASLAGVQNITKTGNGKLILSATNSYSGTFEIAGGITEISASNGLPATKITIKDGAKLIVSADNSISVKTILNIESGGKVQLNNPVVLNELFINGVMQDPGIYNATTHANVFEGTASVTVGRPTMFEWNPTSSKTWENADNYKPALLPLAGDTVTVETEMEINATPFAGTILLKKTNLRFRANAVCEGDLIMSDGTTLSFATSGAGFSLDTHIKLEGNVTMQMSGAATGNYMSFLGSFEGNSIVTAYNYTNTAGMISRVILSGNNELFTGTWSAEKASRQATSSSAFEATAENAFGKGKIIIGSGNLVFFSHEKAASSANELKLASTAKAIMNKNATVGKLTLGSDEFTSGTFNATSHPAFFEGSGTLTVTNDGGNSINGISSKATIFFDGQNLNVGSNINQIRIYSLNGICVKQLKNEGKNVIPLSLTPGSYIVKATGINDVETLKILVNN